MSNDGQYIPPALRNSQQGVKVNEFIAQSYGLKQDVTAPQAEQRPQAEYKPRQQGFKERDGFKEREGGRDDHFSRNAQPVIGRDFTALFESRQSFFSKDNLLAKPPTTILYNPELAQPANYEVYKDVVVTSTGKDEPIQTFFQLKVSQQIHQAIQACQFTQPTPVQQHSVIPALAGLDLRVEAQTGSGKTAAFAIPCIQRVLDTIRVGKPTKKASPVCLVVLPTRELAQQTIFNFYRLSNYTHIRCCVAYGGGVDTGNMIQALRHGCDILIGTPGKLIDFYEQGFYTLSQTQIVVLDEADRCLEMGFEDQIRQIIQKQDLGDHQTLLFSATFPREVQQLVRDFTKERVDIAVGQPTACENVDQSLVMVRNEQEKLDNLIVLVKSVDAKAIVFCDTKVEAKDLARTFESEGINCEVLQGDMDQRERNAAINSFKKDARLLVATDCAQRGLDIPGVGLVVNFTCPRSSQDYVHRVGRTGRVGKAGQAVTYVDRNVNQSILRTIVQEVQKAGQTVDPQVEEAARMFGRGGRREQSERPRRKEYERPQQREERFANREEKPFQSREERPYQRENKEENPFQREQKPYQAKYPQGRNLGGQPKYGDRREERPFNQRRVDEKPKDSDINIEIEPPKTTQPKFEDEDIWDQ